MSTYVFSDVHGHRATLDRVLSRVSPSDDDIIVCLGDMIDRGPDPVGTIKVVRSLPNVRVLMGNHEDLMLAYFDDPNDRIHKSDWMINGGWVTLSDLLELTADERNEMLTWVAGLPRWDWARLNGVTYILVHAGLNLRVSAPKKWDDVSLASYLNAQDPDDLVWIRDEFWGARAGLSGRDGTGPIVVAGHTPTPYLARMTRRLDRNPVGEDGLARMVRVGAAADRWDIDAGAAGGAGYGQVLMLRLDDGEEFYEPVQEGE